MRKRRDENSANAPIGGVHFIAVHCSENVCVALANFKFKSGLWISLCAKGYKAGFCCGMQQSVIFLSF
ncbi:hypothetical protein F3J27_22055 [Enterobacter sp. Ap-916]|nr:hypothetical protein [Enterobacter sp. Ap-867]NIG32150.1 hypothetical protein [Enterobacter sp. Ap-916]